jgi:hypothetical protein
MKPKTPQSPGLRRMFAACAVMTLTAAAVPSALAGGKPVFDAELVKILAELRDEQRDEFDINVDRWKEVETLLKEYIKYSKVEEERHKQWQQNQTLLSKAQKDKFAQDFKAMTDGVRDIKGKDMASQALASGMSSGGVSPGSLPLGFDLASLANLESLFKNLGNPEDLITALSLGSSAPDDLKKALEQVVGIWDSARLADLDALVKKMQADSNMPKYTAEKLTMSNQRLKHGMDEQLRNLEQVQATAKAGGSRLTTIQALVQQAGELGGTDADGKPKFDAAKLAELRAYMSSVTAMQNEELIKLQAKDMGDRATANLMRAGTEAKQTEKALQRATSK